MKLKLPLLFLALAAPLVAQDAEPTFVVFEHVHVVDAEKGEVSGLRLVAVKDERIVAVASMEDGREFLMSGPNVQVIDGDGGYLIPGLWDMHVHALSSPRFAELFIANGVTGVRDLFTQGDIRAQRSDYLTGAKVGPRLVAAGRILDGEKPFWPGSLEAKSPDEGRAAVTTLREDGADFVKVYSKLSRETYFAIAEEARKQEFPFAGHVPFRVKAAEAARAGQRSIEHLEGVLPGCSSEEERLTSGKVGYRDRERIGLETYDGEKAAALVKTFADEGTWHCPTLSVLHSIAHLDDEEFVADERLQYLPLYWKAIWDPKSDRRFKSYSEEDWASARRGYAKSVELVGMLHAGGVGLLAGTDCANPFCFPGFSLHDELERLVSAGLSPAEALRTATWNPAVFLGRTEELGSVEVGKLADLVLLAENPLEDIARTRGVQAVVANGRLFHGEVLGALLEK